MSDPVTITVPRVDVELLREQRDTLLTMVDGVNIADRTKAETGAIDGVINLLDAMLDIAEES